jgi:hypothetical protein
MNSGCLGTWGYAGVTNALRTGLVAIVFVAVVVSRSAADEIQSCRVLASGVSVMTRLDEAPASLVRASTERVGEVVPPDAAIDTTDVVTIGKNRRLVFIWNRGTGWVVATEHGGRVWNYPVFTFDIDRDGNAMLVQTEAAYFNTMCETASSLLGSCPLGWCSSVEQSRRPG